MKIRYFSIPLLFCALHLAAFHSAAQSATAQADTAKPDTARAHTLPDKPVASKPSSTMVNTNLFGNAELSKWTFVFSPFTHHFNDAVIDAANQTATTHSYVWAIGAEYQIDQRYLAGLVQFSNSFGQPCQYLYFGAEFKPFDNYPEVFTKLTGGVIHGYKAPYDNKIPFNSASGWGPGVIPSVGWKFNKNMSAQLNMLGTAGVMLQLSYTP